MHISATGSRGPMPAPVSAGEQYAKRGADVSVEGRSRTVEAAGTDVTEPTAAGSSGEDRVGPKGVLGLLQAGHFRGVAAVRLSINFHAQLMALDEVAAGSRVAGAMDDLQGVLDKVGESVPDDAGAETIERVGAARDAFASAAGDLIDKFRNGETGQDGLSDGMKAEFGILTAALREALVDAGDESGEAAETAPVPEDGEDGNTASFGAEATGESPGPVSPGRVDPVSPVDAALADIGQAFSDYLDGLQADLEMIAAVPEFVAPDNNGTAFEKFIAMYRELSASVEAVEAADDTVDTAPAEGIDQQV